MACSSVLDRTVATHNPSIKIRDVDIPLDDVQKADGVAGHSDAGHRIGNGEGKDVDGGWAWMVLAAVCLDYFVVDSGWSPSGLYNTAFSEVFQKDAFTISLVSALPGSLITMAGVLASVLAERFGEQVVIVVGGIMVTTGALLSAFSHSFVLLVLGFSVLRGVGHSLAYIPSMIVLGGYFDRYRTQAFAVASCFTGIGGILTPVIVTASVESYGWRGSLVIIAGYSLHYFLIALICKPLHMDSFTAKPSRQKQIKRPKTQRRVTKLTNYFVTQWFTWMKTGERSYDVSKQDTKGAYSSAGTAQLRSISVISSGKIDKTNRTQTSSEDTEVVKVKNTVKQYFNFVNGFFIVLLLSQLFMMMGLSILFIHLPSYLVANGATHAQASYAASVIGVMNILSRAGVALVALSKANTALIYVLIFILASISLMLVEIICVSFWGYLLYAGICGFFCNANMALVAVLTIECVGLDDFGKALGAVMMGGGIGYLVGSPIGGFLYDRTDSLANSFYLAGSCYALAAIIMIPALVKSLMENRRINMTTVNGEMK